MSVVYVLYVVSVVSVVSVVYVVYVVPVVSVVSVVSVVPVVSVVSVVSSVCSVCSRGELASTAGDFRSVAGLTRHTGWRAGSVGTASDFRSKGRRFEPRLRQEHRKTCESFSSGTCCALWLSVCPSPRILR